MAMTEMATAQKAAETGSSVGIALLKQAQRTGEAEAMALLQALPQAPSIGGVGNTVDVSA